MFEVFCSSYVCLLYKITLSWCASIKMYNNSDCFHMQYRNFPEIWTSTRAAGLRAPAYKKSAIACSISKVYVQAAVDDDPSPKPTQTAMLDLLYRQIKQASTAFNVELLTYVYYHEQWVLWKSRKFK